MHPKSPEPFLLWADRAQAGRGPEGARRAEMRRMSKPLVTSVYDMYVFIM